jgi:hypothetical protein
MINMRRLLLTITILLVCKETVSAQGSGEDKFSEDASSTFGMLAGQARHSFFGELGFESFVKNSHLSKKNGGELSGGSWATWEAGNSSGHVTVYGAFEPNKKQNHFWVRYDVPTEIPMPQAMLAHLLGRSREIAVFSGDTVELKLPAESVAGGCTESYTLRIRMTTGALVSNVVEDYCTVP